MTTSMFRTAIKERDYINVVGRSSVIGTATAILAGRSRVRMPVGALLSVPVQTSLMAYPASYTMGPGFLSRG
jgi:hypothetical protein